MQNNVKITDLGSGLKGINFAEWGGIEGFLAATSNGASGDRDQLLRRVNPWIAKGQDMTALAASTLPFDLLDENDKIFDSTEDWKNKIGGMETPSDLLYLLASSLCLGKAYVIPETTSRMIVSLQYCAPNTVQPDINMSTGQLQWLQRTTNTGANGRYWPADAETDAPGGFSGEMMYFWLPDSDVEIGPALSYPAGVARMSAELMLGMDSSLKILSDHNFIPPTLLGLTGRPSPDERKELETFYNRFVRGLTQLTKIINAEKITTTKMGAGIEEVSTGYPPLIRQAIENIGTAYGIPAALFMSDAAFASEMNALIKVWYTTSVFIRIYHTIEHTFNTQLLNRFGLRMKFRPETLDAFQENEEQRSASFSVYVGSGIKPSYAAQMVGMKLPDGITYDMLDPEKVETPAQLLPPPPPPEPVEDMDDDTDEEEVELDADMVKDLQAWQQIALMRHRKGKPLPVEFECKTLPDALADKVRSRLKSAHTEGQVFAAFGVGKDDRWIETAQRLTAALEAANE